MLQDHPLLQHVGQLQVRDVHRLILSKGLVAALGPRVQLKRRVPNDVEQPWRVLLFDALCLRDGGLCRPAITILRVSLLFSLITTSSSCVISAFTSTAALGITSFISSSITGRRMTSASVAGGAELFTSGHDAWLYCER